MDDTFYVISRTTDEDFDLIGSFCSRSLAEAYINETLAPGDEEAIYSVHAVKGILEPVTQGLMTKVTMFKDGTVFELYPPVWVPHPQTAFRLTRHVHTSLRETAAVELELNVRVATDDINRAVEVADQVRKFLLANNAWNQDEGRGEGWLLAYGDRETTDPI